MPNLLIVACLAVIAAWIFAEGPKAALRKALAPLAAIAALVLTLLAVWSWWLQPAIDRQVATWEQRIDRAVPDAPTLPKITLPWDRKETTR